MEAAVGGGFESSRPDYSLCTRGSVCIASAAGRRLSPALGHALRWGLRKYFTLSHLICGSSSLAKYQHKKRY